MVMDVPLLYKNCLFGVNVMYVVGVLSVKSVSYRQTKKVVKK